ncbi:MAG: pseudaminic acid cytidylyltransferase [Dissulfuribacterales bacterium]
MGMNVAVIPARGGSKRIPLKNIKLFSGLPMIAWSIRAACETGLFERIIVSTDSEEIAKIAQEYGAQCPFIRPKELADDFTGTNAVVKHAIEWLMANDRRPPDYVCCIYATASLIQPHYIKKGYEMLMESHKSFAFSITSFPSRIQRALRLKPDMSVEMFYPEHAMTRSQDLEDAFYDAGQFYWGRADAFLKELPLFSAHSVGVRLPRYLVQDIDTMEDWDVAEYMFEAIKRKKEKEDAG